MTDPPGPDDARETTDEPSSAHRFADAYRLAAFLARRFDAHTIIDVGVGSPLDLVGLPGPRQIAYAAPDRLARLGGILRRARLIPHERGRETTLPAPEECARSIVLATGIDPVQDEAAILPLVARLAARVPAVIVVAAPGQSDPARLDAALRQHGLTTVLSGLTRSGVQGADKDAALAILDHCPIGDAHRVPSTFRPLAIVTTYNDAEIVSGMARTFLDDGIDVHVVDNWSTDGTFEQVTAMAAARPKSVTFERFPAAGPDRYFELQAQMRRVQEVAARHAGRWIVHHDSDEIREPPWPGVSLREGLHLVDRMGFSAVDFTILEFLPVAEGFDAAAGLASQLKYFRFPEPSPQVKVWKQGRDRVDLATTAGHDVQFPGRRVFPYNFALKHYPYRSPDHARQKIMARRARYPPHERALLWHTHNDGWAPDERFMWRAEDLMDVDAPETGSTFLIERVSCIGTEGPAADAPRADADPAAGDPPSPLAAAPARDPVYKHAAPTCDRPAPGRDASGRVRAFLSSASFWEFEASPSSPWMAHAPVFSWLADVHRPRRIVVEGAADSAAAVTMAEIAGRIGLEFSCVPTAASWSGESASIDLLHVEGGRDLALWRPRLSPRAVIGVFRPDAHAGAIDTGLTSADADRFEFDHHERLVVLRAGSDVGAPVRGLFAAAGDDMLAEEIRSAYARLGSGAVDRAARHRLRDLLAAKDDALRRTSDEVFRLTALMLAARTAGDARTTELGRMSNQLAAARSAADVVQAELEAERAKVAAQSAEHAALAAAHARVVPAHADLANAYAMLEAHERRLTASLSWRITRPVRWLGRRMPWIRSRLGAFKPT